MNNKQTILGFRRWQFIFICTALPVLLVSGIFTQQPWPELLLALFSVVTLMLLAGGKRAGAAFGVPFCAGHGLLFFSRGVYGLAAFNALIAAPVYLVSFIAWGKHKSGDGSTVTIKRLSKRQWMFTVLASAVVFSGGFFVLRATGSAQPALDAFTLAMFMPALFLIQQRYVENWILHITGNLVSAVIWLLATLQDPMNFNFLLITGIATTINIIGLTGWLKLERDPDEVKS
ncbi:MAG: nicotinamide riboside transporter PnuC [Oscillospiraceae bacterium]|nr:nicotinamide riboside transporter PnuC [Oscillospiraceae bacterium]